MPAGQVLLSERLEGARHRWVLEAGGRATLHPLSWCGLPREPRPRSPPPPGSSPRAPLSNPNPNPPPPLHLRGRHQFHKRDNHLYSISGLSPGSLFQVRLVLPRRGMTRIVSPKKSEEDWDPGSCTRFIKLLSPVGRSSWD